MQALANRVAAGIGIVASSPPNIPQFTWQSMKFRLLKYPSLWEPNFVKLLHAVESIYAGSAADITLGNTVIDNRPKQGAVFFGMLNKLERQWFKTEMIAAVESRLQGLRLHERVADMNICHFGIRRYGATEISITHFD